jgi:multicomponent K+:H+ antiporter subunit G
MIVDAIVALLLLASGVLALAGALGVARLPDFFLRLHASSLATTLAAWTVTLACIVHFSAGPGPLSLHVWLIVIVLAIAAPVTTVLVARAALFRERVAGGESLPPPLSADD